MIGHEAKLQKFTNPKTCISNHQGQNVKRLLIVNNMCRRKICQSCCVLSSLCECARYGCDSVVTRLIILILCHWINYDSTILLQILPGLIMAPHFLLSSSTIVCSLSRSASPLLNVSCPSDTFYRTLSFFPSDVYQLPVQLLTVAQSFPLAGQLIQ